MAKLFVVATPLQLLVAQQVVRQEEFKDAVLLESYIQNPAILASYDLCRIDCLWMERLPRIAEFSNWDHGGTRLTHTALTTWHRFKALKRSLKSHHIDSIFLADYQNQTYRFMTVLFSHFGYKVSFFEEGYSQYVIRPYQINKGIIAKAKEVVLDLFYYLPFYHIKFARWRNNPNRPPQGLPIHRRYSIVPGILHEKFDVRLYCQPLVSDKLRIYLDKEIQKIGNGKKTLLLTDPMSEILPRNFRYIYFDQLKKAISSLDKGTILFIKYHPRDTKEDKERTENLVSQVGLQFKVLSSEVNIAIEYYLQAIQFDEILFFNTSTFFYNGYLFPKCKFQSLLPRVLEECIQKKAPEESIRHIRSLIQKMKETEVNQS